MVTTRNAYPGQREILVRRMIDYAEQHTFRGRETSGGDVEVWNPHDEEDPRVVVTSFAELRAWLGY